MIKPKQIKIQPHRKPSLPVKRNISSVHSNYSSQSCMSDRIIYKKDISNTKQLQTINTVSPYLISEKSARKIRNKLSAGSVELTKKQEHMLTGFQWLIIMRHCFHIQNKKRAATIIKKNTLISYIRNRLYPDSLWNKILVLPHQKKFTTEDLISRIEKQTKGKLNLDEIFVLISKCYPDLAHQENESAAETARFVEQMKAPDSGSSFLVKGSQKVLKKQESSKKVIKVTPSSINCQKSVHPMNETDLNQFNVSKGLNISPISVIDQTSNNISFSMEESSQSQFSQSHKFTQPYESTKIDPVGKTERYDRFQAALGGLQSLKQKLKNSKISEQKNALLGFMEILTSYSLYSSKKGKNEGSMSRLGSKKVSISSVGEEPSHLQGLKLQDNEFISKISHQVLKRVFDSREFLDYFQGLQALKISNHPQQISLLVSYIGQNIKILNLSSNRLRSINFIKDICTENLQFINVNHNKITNMGQLLSIPKLSEIHLKDNQIDHVSSDKVLAKEVKLIDLSWNQIQKEEDLWALRNLSKLSMLNLNGNKIMKNFKSVGLLPRQIILDYSEVYIFSGYTQYKDIAFETKNPASTNKKLSN